MAYKNAIKNCELSGPTNFAKIIEEVTNFVSAQKVSQEKQVYNILVILTDGGIQDLEETIDEIVKGSSLALSIIIVGVGQEDFS